MLLKLICRALPVLWLLAIPLAPALAAACSHPLVSEARLKPIRELLADGSATSQALPILVREPKLSGSAGNCRGDALARLVLQAHETLMSGGLVVLGEVHDNALHHRLRSRLLELIVPQLKPRTALVFEHLRADQSVVVDRLNKDIANGSSAVPAASAVLAELDWQRSGWPDAAMFEPLFEAALRLRLPILSGDPARGRVRDIARRGAGELGDGEAARLVTSHPLPPPLDDALAEELVESHCGLMPKTAFGKMSLAQRYRDAHLANAAIAARDRYGSAVLLTGNGHARDDRGVPFYLAKARASLPVLTIALVERKQESREPDHPPKAPDGTLAADFVITTARQPRPDPCDEMRRMMERRTRSSK